MSLLASKNAHFDDRGNALMSPRKNMMGALPGKYNDKQKHDLIMSGLNLIHQKNQGGMMRDRHATNFKRTLINQEIHMPPE